LVAAGTTGLYSLLCCFLLLISAFPPPAEGQTATAGGGGGGGGGGGVERIQVMFTPTICKVRCSQDRCVNYCERGNVTTLYSSTEAGGRRDGAHGPGFRVCKSYFLAISPSPTMTC
uniref:Secreted protein n=1 Tax=Acanthochromis polyacanthus TaxID=80966 RepID=A0A3Q1GT57_9TELE